MTELLLWLLALVLAWVVGKGIWGKGERMEEKERKEKTNA